MSIFKGLGWLFRSLWRLLNFTRLMLVNLLFLLVVLVIVFSVSQSETPSTPIEGALTLNLSGVLVEQRTQTDPTVQLLRQMDKGDEQPSEIVLSDLPVSYTHLPETGGCPGHRHRHRSSGHPGQP